MKRRISIILLLIATLMFSLLAFTACGNDNDENGAKQVPVYQGMTITKSNSVLSLASYRMSGITLLSANNGNNGDNGNHYGHYKGDHTDRNDTIDEDNPYPDNNANENIEEEIKSSLNVVGSPDKIYYATPNEDIYINIHIDNPDSFEIMSFTLNGKKYSSYMFEEGSDMETIVLKYNVGDATGIVEYTIDAIKYIDGTEIKDVIIDGNKTVMAGIRTENQVVASVTDVDIDTNVLSFNVNVKDNNSLVEFSKGALKAVIYDGFNIISEKDIAVGNNSVIFDGLKTNTLYQYAVVGYYDDLSGGGFGMNVLYKDAFYTDSIVLFDNIEVRQESISFGYLWHEDHQNKTISALKLYKGDSFVKDIDVNTTEITELLSNTTYKFVAEYSNVDNTESIYLEFTTDAKAAPSFTVKNENVTTDSVTAEYDIIDVDKILSYYKVELYKGNTLVLENANKKIDFTGLDCYTNYTVKITCMYDLNDGNGEQTVAYDYAYKTLPYIDVVECNVANTSAVSEGETIFMSVKLDNPLGMKIESVVINGATYSVTGASTTNKIFVEIVYNGQFAGGDTYLKIDKVNAKIDDVTLTAIPETELSDNVFINGKLEVFKVEFVNDSFEPIDWAFPSDTVYVLITLDNPTSYIIDAVNTNVTELIKIDDNKWYYATTLNNAWNRVTLSNISYRNEYIRKTVAYSDIYANCYQVASDEIKYISTPSDLKNMEGGYYYELTKDIDLSGLEWLGAEFNGVLNGKNHTIKNMSFIGTIKNSDARLGLFSTGTGVIKNIGFEASEIVVNIVSDDGESYSAYVGLLVAQAERMKIDFAWNTDSYVSITNTSSGGLASNGVEVGGFIGSMTYSSIYNSINYASIFSNSEWGMTGGIVGNAGESIIGSCCNYGQISSNHDAGGIAGGGCEIINCINLGDISGGFAAGGIAGWGGNESIKNCINAGKILGGSYLTAGIAGQRWNSKISNCINVGCIESQKSCAAVAGEDNYNVENCYGIKKYASYDELCSVEELNNKSFYTDILGWSEDIWDFTELDVENGKYPKLKQ